MLSYLFLAVALGAAVGIALNTEGKQRAWAALPLGLWLAGFLVPRLFGLSLGQGALIIGMFGLQLAGAVAGVVVFQRVRDARHGVTASTFELAAPRPLAAAGGAPSPAVSTAAESKVEAAAAVEPAAPTPDGVAVVDKP